MPAPLRGRWSSPPYDVVSAGLNFGKVKPFYILGYKGTLYATNRAIRATVR